MNYNIIILLLKIMWLIIYDKYVIVIKINVMFNKLLYL